MPSALASFSSPFSTCCGRPFSSCPRSPPGETHRATTRRRHGSTSTSCRSCWLHGWYPGAYLGHPLLLYYFPLRSSSSRRSSRSSGFPSPSSWARPSACSAAASRLHLVSSHEAPVPGPASRSGSGARVPLRRGQPDLGWDDREHPDRGVLLHVRRRARCALPRCPVPGERAPRLPLGPGSLPGLVASAHGYAVLWAGLTASAVLFGARCPGRTLVWLLAVAALAFGFAAPFLLPLMADWGWTTPYHDAWIDVSTTGLVPPLLWPLLAAAAVGLVVAVVRRRADGRLVLLGHGALVGAALAAAGPALGVIDVRFIPLAQLSLSLLGAAVLGLASPRWPARTWPPSGSCSWRSSTPTRARASCAIGSTGLLRTGKGRSCGRPGATSTIASAAGWGIRGWPSSTERSTSARAPSGCTRRCPSSPAARPSKASTTRRA